MKQTNVQTGDVLEVFTPDYGQFDKCVAELSAVRPSVDVFGAEKIALVRVLTGPESDFSKNGCWAGETFNYKGNEIVIAPRVVGVGKYSPIFANPVGATNAHRNGQEFYFDDAVWKELRDMAEKDPEKAVEKGVPFLLSRKNLSSEIPVSAFGDDAETVYLFKDMARKYGEFLQSAGISSVPRYVLEKEHVTGSKHEGRAIARALWVGSLNYRSNLVGDSNLDCYDGRLLGGRSAKISPLETKVVENPSIVRHEDGTITLDGLTYQPLPARFQQV